jgi:hypothetical protein
MKCLRILYSYNIDNFSKCKKCGNKKFYIGKKYERICTACKKKTSVTQNTIFENVRFGLVKAFGIIYELHNSNDYLSSITISKRYGITQKSAWLFMNKISNNKNHIQSILNTDIKTHRSIMYEYENMKKLYNLF